MCAILGLYQTEIISGDAIARFSDGLDSMAHRGPDDRGTVEWPTLLLGHRRLSILDLSAAGHQPMQSADRRYTLIFNGEIFNFRTLRDTLLAQGHTFRSTSDTEVLLQLYMVHGEKCLPMLNGFFAFAVYDAQEQQLLIARDRYGIKPLYYYFDNQKFVFGSELTAVQQNLPPTAIDTTALGLFLQLTYIPEPYSIYRGTRKLESGHFMIVRQVQGKLTLLKQQWYELPLSTEYGNHQYREVCELLYRKMSSAVERRLISDVPLGCFLSGGVDSSILAALASRYTSQLHTYSIGFKNDAYFDETAYSERVAQHCGTLHTTFRLDDETFTEALPAFQQHMDEPFADSSALAVYILSRETRKHVTVSLSGDGSDELFAGYNKHRAEYKLRQLGPAKYLVQLASLLFHGQQGSRNSAAGNFIRQLHRLAEGVNAPLPERYWKWCTINRVAGVLSLLREPFTPSLSDLQQAQHALTRPLENSSDFNAVLRTDVKLLLPGDMLRKADLMSMANSLEVRVPFLDYEVVELAFRMPASFKIDGSAQKKILRDTFGTLLPPDIFTRKKQGFEVPLASIYRGKFKQQVDALLSPAALQAQGIFREEAVAKLLQRVYSDQPGEANAQLWTLLTFQFWWHHKHTR